MHLGWVDLDLGVPPSSAQPLTFAKFPSAMQNRAYSGTLKTQVNPTQVHEQMVHPVED